MKKVGALLLMAMLFAICLLPSSAFAYELGNNTASNPFPDKDFSEAIETYTDENDWMVTHLGNFPRLWTGEYEGNSGAINVMRKYAFKIQDMDFQARTFSGVAFVDKHPDSRHPELQVRGSYNFYGTIDPATHSISFHGSSFIDAIPNFDFVTFNLHVGDDLTSLSGTTTAHDGSTASFKPASTVDILSPNISFEGADTNFDPNLAAECIDLSLLEYGETVREASGYYCGKKGAGYAPLFNKLCNEGFKKANIKEMVSSEFEGDTIDSIHWHLAHRSLADGTELVYVILRGTYQNEWHGDFNVTGKTDTYDSSYEGRHYSFESAANALCDDLADEVGGKYDKVKYVVTGHSRGAAVSNLVAKQLTDKKLTDSTIQGVYAYTFATPAVVNKTEAQSKSYDNIFNFCLDDDFVTYMPLADANWQYGRYGTTYYASACKLYKKNAYFKGLMKYYRDYSPSEMLSYKKTGGYNLADAVLGYCPSVKNFYKETDIGESWYHYFYIFFATLMNSGEPMTPGVASLAVLDPFVEITKQIAVGGVGYATGNYEIMAYLGTHDPINYYGMIQCMLQDPNVVSESSDLRDKLARKYKYDPDLRSLNLRAASFDDDGVGQVVDASSQNEGHANGGQTTSVLTTAEDAAPDNYNETDAEAIRNLLTTEGNEGKVSWDPDDVSTWEGITWADGRISEVDISGYGLLGELDVSELSELKKLDCSGNLLTGLYLGEIDLEELICENNLLDVREGSGLKNDIDRLNQRGDFVYSYYPQTFASDVEFNENDVAKLTALARTGSNLDALGWDLGNPASFSGVKWGRIGDENRIISIDLSGTGIAGSIDLSEIECLESLDLHDNQLTELNITDCWNLRNVDVSNNALTRISYSDDKTFNTLICDHNYMTGDEYQKLLDLADGEETVVSFRPQYVSAGPDAFDDAELATVMALLSGTGKDIDWSHPGTNDYIRWIEVDGKFHVAYLDLSSEDLPERVDIAGLNHLTEVTFENTNVHEVKLPQSLTTLGDRAFAGCTNLTDLEVCDSWNKMGMNVFRDCGNLTIHCVKGTFANFIADAFGFDFDGIVALDYITVEGSGANVGYQGEDYSLNGAKIIAHYTDGTTKAIEDGFEVIGYDNSQMGEQTIKVLYKDGDYSRELEYDVKVYGLTGEGMVYDQDGENYTIADYKGNDVEVTVPNSIDGKTVIKIEDNAFAGNKNIRKVSIPSCVEIIGESAFSGCENLREVDVVEGLKEIGYKAFSNCKSLKEFLIPDGFESLGGYVFQNCTSLEHVRLNAGRQNITEGLFSNCTSLKKVDIPDSVKYVRNNAFYKCSSLASINLPAGLELIGSSAFSNCSSLGYIKLGSKITSIGGYAFEKCTGLTSFAIPEGITFIASGMFLGCAKLTRIVIPSNIKSIESYAFSGCTGLTEMTVPNSVTNIGSGIFKDCTALKKAVIGTGVDYLSSYTFRNCTSLTSVTLPKSLKSISYSVFENCKSLKTVTIPGSVESISDSIFVGSGITSIKYNGTVAAWKNVNLYSYGNELFTELGVYCIADGKYYPDRPATKVNVKKTAFVKLVGAKKALKVKWKKVSGVTGYQIQYGLKKYFKNAKKVTVKKAATVSKTVKKLKAKKKYFVRIRAYKKAGGKVYYSGWTKAKAVKTK